MGKHYDPLAVGSGVAASGVASRARQAGAEPLPLGIPGQEHAITNEEFLSLEATPERVVFIGGGYIAAEFSNIAALAGARVTVLQRSERMLTGFDPDLVGWLMDAFRAMGITVATGVKVEAIEGGGSQGFRVRYSAGGTSDSVAADVVVHAAGRRPAPEPRELVPTVAFTIPPIASVGLGEAAARVACRNMRVHCRRTSGRYAARGPGEPVCGFKVLTDEASHRILGAHLVGPGAEATINLFALAIREHLTTDALRAARFAYPTAASDISYML